MEHGRTVSENQGERKYLFAMLDSKTGFWLVKMVATCKGNDDVAPMFADAKKKAGNALDSGVRPCRQLSSCVEKAVQVQELSAQGLRTPQTHSHVRDMDNNPTESFNGNTVRHREKVIRGLKHKYSPMLTGLQIYHNFVRPHLGLGGMTPGEAAGISIRGGEARGGE